MNETTRWVRRVSLSMVAPNGNSRRVDGERHGVPEWFVVERRLPLFLRKLADEWELTSQERQIHQALAGIFLGEKAYWEHSELRMPLENYVIETIVPDISQIVHAFSQRNNLDLFEVKKALTEAFEYIKGSVLNSNYLFPGRYLNTSPFVSLYRGNAPLIKLHEAVILTPARFNRLNHNYFVNKDMSFSNWLIQNLKTAWEN